MNLDLLQKKLLEAARKDSPPTQVPYAFEKRIMARLQSGGRSMETRLVWAVGLWRATVPCLILLSGIALWNWSDSANTWDSGNLSGDELELAVVDAIDLSDNFDE